MAEGNETGAAPAMVACDITGELVPADEIVEIQGYRVGARGKQLLLEQLRSGETLPGEMERSTVLRRFGGIFLDSILLGIVGALVGAAVGLAVAGGAEVFFSDDLSDEAAVLTNFVAGMFGGLIALLYFGLMHARDGQTLGKRAVGIRVVNPDGTAISTGRAFHRALWYAGPNFLPPIAMLIALGGNYDVAVSVVLAVNIAVGIYAIANIITALVDRQQQRAIHDRMAGTRVIMVN